MNGWHARMVKLSALAHPRLRARRQAGAAWLSGLAMGLTILGPLGGTGAGAQTASPPVDLGTLCNTAGFSSTALGVNADGTVVVGQTCVNTPNGIMTHAFRWTAAGGMVDLGAVNANPDFTAQANGVNADGSVVVGDTNAGVSGIHEAFRWTSATGAVQLPVLPGQCCVGQASANAVNPDGTVIVGWGTSSAANSARHAAKWVNGATPSDLGTLTGGPTSTTESIATAVNADGSVIVGYADSVAFGPQHAFRWTSATGMVDLGTLSTHPNGQSLAQAVSADGSVVVGMTDFGSSTPGTNQRAFRWTQATGMVELGFAGSSGVTSSDGFGVNAAGSVVVGYTTTNSGSGGSGRWTSATGMKDLNDLLVAAGINMTGILLGRANAISSNGQFIVGQGTFSGQQHAYLARYIDATVGRTATHDFNGDAKSDIAWRQSAGTAAIWLMNSAQVTQSGSLGSVPTSWQIVGQRDFNGDGKYDWLWRDGTTNMVAIWLLNGLQVSQSGSLGVVPGDWVIAGTGDFNGDGKGDLLWRNTTTNTVAIWLLNGLQVIGSGSLGVVPTNWVIAGTGDFNGDGKADILWRDNTTGTVAIWLLNGVQVTSSGSLGVVPGTWQIVGTGDFNGDGKSDILWRDGTSGTLAIWLLNALQVSQSGSLGVVPAAWTIAETGDFNGDGKSDLLWRNTTSGAAALWFLNGLQVLSSAGLGTIGLDWTIQAAAAD